MAINWNKMTVKTQEAVQAAASMAAENGNPEDMQLHLFNAVLVERDPARRGADRNERARDAAGDGPEP